MGGGGFPIYVSRLRLFGPRRVPFRVLNLLGTYIGGGLGGLIFARVRIGVDPLQVPGDSPRRSASLSAVG